MSEVARYFNLNFCNPSFNSRYKSLLIWYLSDIWTTYKEIHLCLYYVWIMHTITAWPQQTLLICLPKNHYNVNKLSADISCCCEMYMSPARWLPTIYTVLLCKYSKEIILLCRKWYIQYIPNKSNLVSNDIALIILNLF